MKAAITRNWADRRINWTAWLVVGGVILAAAVLGRVASGQVLVLTLVGAGVVLFARKPVLGLPGLIGVALIVPVEIGTGRTVVLNAATLLVPIIMALWLLGMAQRGRAVLVSSPVNAPLLLFMAMGIFSLLVGLALWDSRVPRRDDFLIVQFAQWALYAFSVATLLMASNLVSGEGQLRRLTYFFLLFAGFFAILRQVPGTGVVLDPLLTLAFVRAPFWVLLMGLAGGQLLYNRSLSTPWRLFLGLVLIATFNYAFVVQRAAASNWIGLVATASVLAWFRWPRIRGPVVVVFSTLLVAGVLFPTVYDFAGGDDEWLRTGGSRVALISRVLEDTISHNVLTGLGPAAYRVYGATRPLQYRNIIWVTPGISSHNNYVDIFSQMGLVGVAMFGWFTFAIARLGLELRKRVLSQFADGFVNGILAAGAGGLVLMLLADWILPFVYNIGFPGFQASMIYWMFLGCLVALERISSGQEVLTEDGEGAGRE